MTFKLLSSSVEFLTGFKPEVYLVFSLLSQGHTLSCSLGQIVNTIFKIELAYGFLVNLI